MIWSFKYERSTCFRRFLRPSSGAHNCTYSFRYCQPILLLAAVVDVMERSSVSSTIAARNLELYGTYFDNDSVSHPHKKTMKITVRIISILG